MQNEVNGANVDDTDATVKGGDSPKRTQRTIVLLEDTLMSYKVESPRVTGR